MPQAVALAAENTSVVLTTPNAPAWQYPTSVAERFGWNRERFRIVEMPCSQ